MKIKISILFGIVSIVLLSLSKNSFASNRGTQQNYSDIIQGFSQGEKNDNIVTYSDRLKSYSNSETNEYSINYSDRLVGFSSHTLDFPSSSYAEIISSFTYKNTEEIV